MLSVVIFSLFKVFWPEDGILCVLLEPARIKFQLSSRFPPILADPDESSNDFACDAYLNLVIGGYIRDTGMPVLERARSFLVRIFFIIAYYPREGARER